MVRSIIFAICLLSLLITHAQDETTFRIRGIVQDATSDEPIENVNIQLDDKKSGTTSNELGEFEIVVDHLPFTLQFSHVSFETSLKNFTFPPTRDIIIQLRGKSETLQGVVVTAQKIDTIYHDDIYSVLDYELMQDGILLLIFKARLANAELLYTDFEGKEITTLPVLPGKPLALYRDCLENSHILTKTRAYQVYTEDRQIGIMPGVDIDFFKQTMGGCLFNIRHKLYFEDYLNFNFAKTIFYIDRNDSSYHELTTVIDPMKFDMLKDNPEDFSIFTNSSEEPNLGDLRATEGDSNILSQIRNLYDKKRFLKMAYYSDVYAPVLRVGDSVCIFDHPGNVIHFYNLSDSLCGSTPIGYHLESKKNPLTTLAEAFAPSTRWLKEIYTDAVKRKAYTMNQNINGTRDLLEINLNTGITQYVLTIPFPYVQKIQIRDGYLYFVYRGWGEGQKKKLFRQQIN
ncbi:MAG: carboxypeptidase-like regulatory domain-containing protein [Bacteroidetes bacterium]|nr:carboxypeptidase-like regulatory domain-containing protein [Bacteroidota bacterium]